jgi:Putative transposase
MQDSLPAGGLRLYREGVEPSGSLRKVSGYFSILLSRTSPVARVVFAKPPFAGPEQVLGYLGRYTHRVAIANSRLVGLDEGRVSFTWKDYRQDGKTKVMTIAADEFIRRFLQHTVPSGFHRIRHFGFLANRHRTAKLALCRDLLAAPPPPDPEPPRRWHDRLRDLTGHDINLCPCCGGSMVPHGTLQPCPPPRPPMWCDSS